MVFECGIAKKDEYLADGYVELSAFLVHVYSMALTDLPFSFYMYFTYMNIYGLYLGAYFMNICCDFLGACLSGLL